jgi:hypothetical protein
LIHDDGLHCDIEDYGLFEVAAWKGLVGSCSRRARDYRRDDAQIILACFDLAFPEAELMMGTGL